MKANGCLRVLLLTGLIYWSAEAQSIDLYSPQNNNSSPRKNIQIHDTIEKSKVFSLTLKELINATIITVSKKEEKISEAAAIIEIITESEIKKKGFRSVSEALQSIPGMFVTTDHVSQNVSIRGINGGREASSRNIKVMIDGQSIAYRPTSENFIGTELIPMSMIKQIEVVKGPASALYGANAFLGVVNIITKSGEDFKNTSTFSYGNGSLSQSSFEFASAYSNKDIDLTLGFSYEKIDRSGLSIPFSTNTLKERIQYEYPGISPIGQLTENDYSRPFSLYSTLNIKSKIGSLKTCFYLQELDNEGRFYDENPVLNTNRISIRNWFLKESFHRISKNQKLDFSLSLAVSSGKILDKSILDYYPEANNGFKIKREQSYNGFDFAAELRYLHSEQLNFLVGVDNSYDHHHLLTYQKIFKPSNEVLELVDTEGKSIFNNIGLFWQAYWSLKSKFTFTAGFRYDYQNVYGDNVNYRFGAVYSIAPYAYLKLLIGSSFRSPSPAQLFSPDPPYNPVDGILGNPFLVPETAQTYELSLTSYPSSNLSLHLNAYINFIDSFIIIDRKAGMSKPVNKNKLRSLGFEFVSKWELNSFSGNLGLAYQNSKIKDKLGWNEDVKLFPSLMLYGSLNYTFNHFNLNFQSYYIGEYIASQSNVRYNIVLGKSELYKLPSYFVTNLTLNSNKFKFIENLDKGEINISVSVKNLFDARYSYPGFYKYDIPALGRSYWVKLIYRI